MNENVEEVLADLPEIPPTVINIDPCYCNEAGYLNATFAVIISCIRFFGFCQVSVVTEMKKVGEIVESIKETITAFQVNIPGEPNEKFDYKTEAFPLSIANIMEGERSKLRGTIITITSRPSGKLFLPPGIFSS